MQAADRRFGPPYAPTYGKEHCPKCWTAHAFVRLRFEKHHNSEADNALCDVCGFYLVL